MAERRVVAHPRREAPLIEGRCDWCRQETTDLRHYTVVYRGEGRSWWLSPCCADDMRDVNRYGTRLVLSDGEAAGECSSI